MLFKQGLESYVSLSALKLASFETEFLKYNVYM